MGTGVGELVPSAEHAFSPASKGQDPAGGACGPRLMAAVPGAWEE